jgi:D-alanine-D-alanine ligase-like ATP-grasp enzyme
MTRIGITHDGPSDDCGGTDLHLKRVREALSELGDVVQLPSMQASGSLARYRIDIACNLARGSAGTYHRFQVAALFEHFNVPYTGAQALAHEVTTSRFRLKDVLRAHDVPAAAFSVVGTPQELVPLKRRRFPMAVFRSRDLPRPRERCIARDFDELDNLVGRLLAESGEPLMVEPHIDGASFLCLLIGNGLSRTLLPPVAVEWSNQTDSGRPVVERIPVGMLEELDSMSRRAADAVGCRDWALVEVGLSEGRCANRRQRGRAPHARVHPAGRRGDARRELRRPRDAGAGAALPARGR